MALLAMTQYYPVNSLIDSESLCNSAVSSGEIIALCGDRRAQSPQGAGRAWLVHATECEPREHPMVQTYQHVTVRCMPRTG